MKGQTSFELILLALVIITISIYFTNLYTQTTQTTTIISLAKTEVNQKLNETNFTNIIENIHLEKTSTENKIIINILTENPEEAEKKLTSLFLDNLKQTIESTTKINNITFKITMTKI